MEPTPHAVAFGDELVPLARRMHVWLIDSPVNRLGLDKVWNQTTAYSLESGATLVSDDGTQPPDVVAVRILNDVELHHGTDSHEPPLSHLEIYGTPMTPLLSFALQRLGFGQFDDANGRLAALRPVTPVE